VIDDHGDGVGRLLEALEHAREWIARQHRHDVVRWRGCDRRMGAHLGKARGDILARDDGDRLPVIDDRQQVVAPSGEQLRDFIERLLRAHRDDTRQDRRAHRHTHERGRAHSVSY
jgi:hypothetical protein